MKKVLFIDHAGPLVWEDKGGYPFQTEEWYLSWGAGEALQKIERAKIFDAFALIASHSGVGRGMYTEKDMHRRHEILNKWLYIHYGVTIDATGLCSHLPDAGCTCRKPGTGMFSQIVKQIGPVDVANSYIVGDKTSDMEFGRKCEIGTCILQVSRYWKPEGKPVSADHVVYSLAEAAHLIISQNS